jgi:hypothetical protein
MIYKFIIIILPHSNVKFCNKCCNVVVTPLLILVWVVKCSLIGVLWGHPTDLLRLFGVHVSLSEVLGTMTGACGPYNLGGSATDHGLPWPLLCSGTAQTTTVLENCPDHYCAWTLPRPLLCSGTAPTTAVPGDCSDHYHIQELLWPPLCSGTFPTTSYSFALLGYMWFVLTYSWETLIWILLQGLYFAFQQARDYGGMMHLPVYLVLPGRQLDS